MACAKLMRDLKFVSGMYAGVIQPNDGAAVCRPVWKALNAIFIVTLEG